MRAPCQRCGGSMGRLETHGGQDCVYCLNCGKHCYNAPRTETGRAVRSLRTRPRIPPSQRSRILALDAYACVLCHTTARELDIGHLVSVKEGTERGVPEASLYDDINLAAMCALCNSGLGKKSVDSAMILAIHLARSTRSA